MAEHEETSGERRRIHHVWVGVIVFVSLFGALALMGTLVFQSADLGSTLGAGVVGFLAIAAVLLIIAAAIFIGHRVVPHVRGHVEHGRSYFRRHRGGVLNGPSFATRYEPRNRNK